MPHSSDDPPSAPPSEIVDGEVPSASPPDTAVENASGGDGAVSATAQEAALRRPRRRRRRRRPPSAPLTELASETPIERTVSTAEAVPTDASPDGSPGVGETHRPPRRRRRRRRGPPREPATQGTPATSDAHAEEGRSADNAEQSTSGGEGEQSVPLEGVPPHESVPRVRPHRRYRHRRPPRDGSRPDGQFGGERGVGAEAASGAASQNGPAPIGRSRFHDPRDRRPRYEGPSGAELKSAGSAQRPSQGTESRERGARTSDRRDRVDRSRGPRGTGGRQRHQGRGRDAPQKKPEQKLYALESVVDRGFEDVADESADSDTRRVHWTIVKRTVADQKSGKPMSAVYVLRREGMDAEFPNLGAARAAVNKTIVHPEKLTMSKAEHAAAKK
jgi:hypothetical protein